MVKDRVTRGTRKRFQVYITDLAGNPQDPDTCRVRFIKVGEYAYDSPTQWYSCSKVGSIGEWGADVDLSDSMTLGDWVAHYEWTIGGVSDSEDFEFTVERKDRPFVNARNRNPIVED